jgi:hypothetical protein
MAISVSLLRLREPMIVDQTCREINFEFLAQGAGEAVVFCYKPSVHRASGLPLVCNHVTRSKLIRNSGGCNAGGFISEKME